MSIQPPLVSPSRPTSVLQSQKYPDESRLFTFDFSTFPEILSGNTLVTPTVTATPADGNFVVGTPGVSGNSVTVQLSAGAPGQTYVVKCDVTTNASPAAILTRYLKMFVVDPTKL